MLKKVPCGCGKIRDPRSKSGLCRSCWLEKVRQESPYIQGVIPSGGSQWKDRYGQTYYEKNKKESIRKERERKRELARKLVEYKKTLVCVDCDISDFRIIDFDHINPDLKTKGVSVMVAEGYSWANIMAEIGKCEPVCSNCHRIRTWKRRMEP